jgi:hypothetical protein
MGRSSEDATKASLILWARAARRRRSAGLTCFFLPRVRVAECRALEVFDEALRFDGEAFGSACFFFLWLVLDAVDVVAFVFAAS